MANGRSEHHSSSGVIVSTGAGATGWLSSLFNIANGMTAVFGDGMTADYLAFNAGATATISLAPQKTRLVEVIK